MGTYAVISHTADIGLSVDADDLTDLFATATRAMFELMFGPCVDAACRSRNIEASGASAGELLWDWLSSVLGWAEADGAAYYWVEVDVGASALGVVRGPASGSLELVGALIKAVTLHQLVVESMAERWRAEVIFDV